MATGDDPVVTGHVPHDNEPRYPLTAEALIAFVTARGHVSFVELQRAFEDTRGHEWLMIPDRNLVLWVELSPALAALLQDPVVVAAIEPRPCHWLVYLADGALPHLPQAKRNVAYKKPHWLPVTFSARRRVAP